MESAAPHFFCRGAALFCVEKARQRLTLPGKRVCRNNHLMPLWAKDSMNRFWKKKNTISSGATVRKVAAQVSVH